MATDDLSEIDGDHVDLWDKSKYDKLLLQPYDYILKSSGKQIRSKLVAAFNVWLDIPHEYLTMISEVIEMLHNASLLIDDIEDSSTLRRGSPTAHTIFGVPSTLNAANYVIFLALEKIRKSFPKEVVGRAIDVYSEQLLELHRGQGLDIYWRDNFVCPTEGEYVGMIRRKTGGLFNMGIQLMQLFSKDSRSYSKLIATMGQYFQIRDDYANLISRSYAINKSFGEDLTEGKFSFPIIHAIRSNPDDATLMNIIKQRTKDIEIKKFAVKLMERLGSLGYTKSTLQSLERDLRREIDELGGNVMLSKLLDELSVEKLDNDIVDGDCEVPLNGINCVQ